MILNKILTTILVLILSLQLTQAMGYGISEKTFVIAEPGLTKTFKFSIIPTSSDTLDYPISLEGELNKYITLDPPESFLNVKPNEHPTLTATIAFPDPLPADITPGNHKAAIYIVEGITSQEGGGMFIVRSGVRIWITILSLYDGKFLTGSSISIPNVNENEDIKAEVTMSNYGKEKINSAYAKIDLFDKDNKLVKSFTTNTGSLDTKETITLTGVAKNNLTSGNYDAKATIYWDDKTSIVENTLKVGTLSVNINDFTKELEPNTINEIKITIQSMWNNQLDNVYATLSVGDKLVQTPSTSLNPWQTTDLTGYLNTNELELGEHAAVVKLYYNGGEISSKEGKITISEKETIAQKEQKPKDESSSINMIIVIAIIAVIIIGLNIFWIFKRKKK